MYVYIRRDVILKSDETRVLKLWRPIETLHASISASIGCNDEIIRTIYIQILRRHDLIARRLKIASRTGAIQPRVKKDAREYKIH